MEGDLRSAVRGYLLEISVPGLSRVEPKLIARFAGQQVPGALHILGGEGCAVVPLDSFAQPESQAGLVFVPPPGGSKASDDRLRAGLRNIRPECDKIVED